MKITFKNVDQGDSILLEWIEDGEKKIAIIDCALNDKYENPVLDHIIQEEYRSIRYLILSHPHTDHFSGFPTLLEYCLKENIRIDYFIHTSLVVPDFLKMANVSRQAANMIQTVFKLIRTCRDEFDTVFGTINAHFQNTISLGTDYNLVLLAPTSEHTDNYLHNVEYDHDYEVDGNSPGANWLSTVFMLENNLCNYILLTSDTPKSVLKELGIKYHNRYFIDKLLLLGQSPHHGAKLNHINAFWKNLQKNASTPIQFSVGQNHYKHPSKIAVEYFIKENYRLFSTNKVGAFLDIGDDTQNISSILNLVSTNISTSPKSVISGDQSFIMHDNYVEYIPN